MANGNNAGLGRLVRALWVSLQAVICGLIFTRHRTTITHKNKTTSNRLMTYWSINTKWMKY